MAVYNREQAFERMFVHDEEMRFKALARRNKVLGHWAAEQMRLSREEPSAYAEKIRRNSIVAAQGDEQVVRKLRQDIALDAQRIQSQLRRARRPTLARTVEEAVGPPHGLDDAAPTGVFSLICVATSGG